ncbi:MAG: hypothetical protein AAFP77_02050, partial [Bacteroidota bacterium]
MLVRLLIVQKFIENTRLARPQSRGQTSKQSTFGYADLEIANLVFSMNFCTINNRTSVFGNLLRS